MQEVVSDKGGPSIQSRLSALLAGGPGFESVYACHIPAGPRWCRMSASPLEARHRGAVVLHAGVTSQVQSEVKLHQLANYDERTGVKRRRHFFERLEDAVRSARRYGHPLAVAMAFPHTHAADVVVCLESVRENLAHRIAALALPVFIATFGVAELSSDHADVAQFVGAADRALYRGKAADHDRIEIAAAPAAAYSVP